MDLAYTSKGYRDKKKNIIIKNRHAKFDVFHMLITLLAIMIFVSIMQYCEISTLIKAAKHANDDLLKVNVNHRTVYVPVSDSNNFNNPPDMHYRTFI